VAKFAKLLLVDSDPAVLRTLTAYLSALGHEVRTAGSTADCDLLLDRDTVDLVVLAIDLPGESGLDYLPRLRGGRRIPVLLMASVPDPVDRVLGLELGADDFVLKPFDPQELAARVSGLLRRYHATQRELVRLERVTIDLTAARLLRMGQPPERLGPGEIMLVRAFASRPNLLLSRDDLMELAPADSHDANDRAIDTRVARLRRKLDTESIVTVRGHGYMFVPPMLFSQGAQG
jgi:DNA-binding response OmpR family regulator